MWQLKLFTVAEFEVEWMKACSERFGGKLLSFVYVLLVCFACMFSLGQTQQKRIKDWFSKTLVTESVVKNLLLNLFRS